MNIFKPMNFITIFMALCFAACSNPSGETVTSTEPKVTVEKATIISESEFKTLVMNYETNPENWVYNGKLPCIVDFYADWCGPCKRIAPILDELAREYAGKVNIYKVNVDHNRNLSAYFGIRSIPSMLFCPMTGKPAFQAGGMGKEQMKNAIENFLLKKPE